MSLQEAFSPKKNSDYDVDVKPVIDVDLSLCKEEDKPRMIALINRLAKSPSGLETLEIAKAGNFTFSFFEEEINCHGACDELGNWIKLNPTRSNDKLVGTLAHEARHAGQFVRGAHEKFGVKDVKSELIMFRAMEADAQAYAIRSCYELLDARDAGPFHAFKDAYPEIYTSFMNAVEKNNYEVNNQVMTETYKGWYDQNRIKSAYENSYQIDPMDKEIKNLEQGKKPDLIYTEKMSAEEAVKMACWTKNGNYFTDDPAILETGKYMDVSEANMEKMKEFFAVRQVYTGMKTDSSLQEIPVRGAKAPSVRPSQTDTKQGENKTFSTFQQKLTAFESKKDMKEAEKMSDALNKVVLSTYRMQR